MALAFCFLLRHSALLITDLQSVKATQTNSEHANKKTPHTKPIHRPTIPRSILNPSQKEIGNPKK